MSVDASEQAGGRAPAEYPNGWPVLGLAFAGAIAGIFWFPLWFAAAQLLRIWAPRGGVAWLRDRGVPEYTDERYASAIWIGAVVPIALRILVSFNWLQPFQDPYAVAGKGEMTTLLDFVLGIAIALAMSGVLLCRGWSWLLALTGLAAVVVLAVVVAFRPGFQISGIAAAPLVVLGWLSSFLALFIDNAPARRARREARRLARIEDRRREEQERRDRGY